MDWLPQVHVLCFSLKRSSQRSKRLETNDKPFCFFFLFFFFSTDGFQNRGTGKYVVFLWSPPNMGNQDTRVSPTSRLVVVAPGDARIAPVVGVQQREDGPVCAHDDREGRLVPDGIQVEKLSFQLASCGMHRAWGVAGFWGSESPSVHPKWTICFAASRKSQGNSCELR